MNKDIIFYSPLGNKLSSDKIGGAECASLKTIGILRDAGFGIILLRKPILRKRVIPYLMRILLTWVNLLRLLLVYRKAFLHVVGVYRELMYIEWVFIMTAKVLGHKTVYDIRNGDMIKEYEKRGRLYRRGMLSLLRNSDSVLCQGIDYVRFIKDKLGKSSLYYPNYIQDRFLKEYPKRDMEQCRLVYFGRIVPSKNVDLMLDVCEILHTRGLTATLDLIGGCPNIYKKELEKKIRELELPDNCVRFQGRKDFNEFFLYLKTCHFFLFPSDEPREGHSNSLTEAMGCGIVPIVSDAGFNRQVINNDRLVIYGMNAVSYANVIYEIWAGGEWEIYSRRMYSRVSEHFTECCIRETLLVSYK